MTGWGDLRRWQSGQCCRRDTKRKISRRLREMILMTPFVYGWESVRQSGRKKVKGAMSVETERI